MTIWCDASTAAQIVKSGNRVFLHGRYSTPTPLIEALVARGEELQDVEILPTLSFGPVPYLDPRWKGHFNVNTIFVGASEREAVNAGRASYAPTFLSYVATLFKWVVGWCSTCPDEDGVHTKVPLPARVQIANWAKR